MSATVPEQQAKPATEPGETSSTGSDFSDLNGHFKLDRTQVIWLVVITIIGIAVLSTVLWLLFRYTCTPAARAKGLRVRDGRDREDDDPEAAGSTSGTSRDGESIKLQNSCSLSSFDKTGLGPLTSVPDPSAVAPPRSNSRRVLSPYSQRPSYITHDTTRDTTSEPSRPTDMYPSSILSPRAPSPVSPPQSPPAARTALTLPPARAGLQQHSRNWPLNPPSPIRPLSSCPPSPRLQSPRVGSPAPTPGHHGRGQGDARSGRGNVVISPVSTGEEFSRSLGLGLGARQSDAVDGGRESHGDGSRNRYYRAQIWG